MRNPAAIRFVKTTRRHHQVDMAIELQISTKSVRHGHDERSSPIFHGDPLLNYTSGENWQVVKKMAVAFENRPEFARHGKDHA
jgi:hypothetical protein